MIPLLMAIEELKEELIHDTEEFLKKINEILDNICENKT